MFKMPRSYLNFLTGCNPIPFLAEDFGNLGATFVPVIINGSLDKFKIGGRNSSFSDS